ncbi:hypothetical protein IE53DRAFT_388014 [Violaceomyces palustris]|uniref:Uncharacterized protein n=1 Tax=Violaceomyces palustris TaxID=1673888 RepID=A0ACD0NVA3_9BASI|nr:hypothetical protein IE53DRAFT_388014 [Violaceomyces palustris]
MGLDESKQGTCLRRKRKKQDERLDLKDLFREGIPTPPILLPSDRQAVRHFVLVSMGILLLLSILNQTKLGERGSLKKRGEGGGRFKEGKVMEQFLLKVLLDIAQHPLSPPQG